MCMVASCGQHDNMTSPSVADLGFPVGGPWTSQGGASTPKAAKFHKICMSKRKNWVP